MFVGVSRVTLDIPAAGSLKAKRQVLRRVTDRVKAKFNVAVAEVEDNDVWSRAIIALSVVGNERRQVIEQMDKILQFIEDMYVAPVLKREVEVLGFNDQLFGDVTGEPDALDGLSIPRGDRSLAEAEGMGAFEKRYEGGLSPPTPSAPNGRPKPQSKMPLEQARAVARSLRNRRDWEKG